MQHSNSNFFLNCFDKQNIETFNSEIKDQTHGEGSFSISNFNNLTLNNTKIENLNNLEDYYFIAKTPLLDFENNNINTIEKLKKENSNEEKAISNKLPLFIDDIKVPYNFDNISQNTNQDVDYNKIAKLKDNMLFNNYYLGRKIEFLCYEGEHNKYCDDNIRRKCKSIVLNKTLHFLNEKIKLVYKGKIGNGLRKKELFPINQTHKYDITIEYNKKFIYKTLGEIFSREISPRFKSYSLKHNKEIIEQLINEKDQNKRLYFQKLFDIKFIQCVESFSDSKYYEELKDLKKFNDIKIKYKKDPKYSKLLEYYLKNFEDIIKNKKGRKKNTIDEEEEEKINN